MRYLAKKIKKREMLIGIAVCIVAIATFSLKAAVYSKFNNTNNTKQLSIPVDNKTENITDIKEKCQALFSKRSIALSKDGKCILVGSTEKEVQNGYFDIRCSIQKDGYLFELNKLFKENYPPEQLYDAQYISQIVEVTEGITKISLLEEERNVLEKKIIDTYCSIRNVKHEVQKEQEIVEATKIDQLEFVTSIISFQIKDNMINMQVMKR